LAQEKLWYALAQAAEAAIKEIELMDPAGAWEWKKAQAEERLAHLARDIRDLSGSKQLSPSLAKQLLSVRFPNHAPEAEGGGRAQLGPEFEWCPTLCPAKSRASGTPAINVN
jgi:hypothetical protein